MNKLINTLRAKAAKTVCWLRGRNCSWTAAMHDVVYYKGCDPAEDCRREICDFFGCDELYLENLRRTHGECTSEQFHEYVRSFFLDRTESDEKLFGAYSSAALAYSLMLGVGCPRYATVFPFMEYILSELRSLGRPPVALDYGCGVGDAAILLSALGFQIHLVDLPDRKSEFTRWRLRRRGCEPNFIPVTADALYPKLPIPIDLVVTIEVWEHLRHPLTALRNINAATTPGSAFLINTNVDFDHLPIGDHLQEGMKEGKSDEYRRLYNSTWTRVPIESPDGALYRRI